MGWRSAVVSMLRWRRSWRGSRDDSALDQRTPFLRETFAAFEIQKVPMTWQISAQTGSVRVHELLITNAPR